MSESHAEIKDRCDGLETRLDEIAVDIRDLPFDYKLVERYSHIDEEIHEIEKWYETMRDFIKRYTQERSVIDKKLKHLEYESKMLNNDVQNLKLQAFSRDQHEDLCSQRPNTQHL